MINKINSLVIKIQLPESQITNESLLEEDEKILEPSHHKNNEESDNKAIKNFDEKKDFELT